jgi:hypothetical protein
LQEFALLLVLLAATSPLQAETLVFHASMSGKQTLDKGEGGGNPFASALIEILQRPSFKLSELPVTLQNLTKEKSKGYQLADGPVSIPRENDLMLTGKQDGRRIALVLVVSDYARSGGAPSLPGAKLDAARIASTLQGAGFDTELALDLRLEQMQERLTALRARSIESDVAAVYTTGHGVEVDGTVFLLPGDYPIAERNSALQQRALPLPQIARSLSAKQASMVFYAGCRNNPFGQ